MPSKRRPGDLQSLPNWSQNHEKSILETFWTHLGQNAQKPRFWTTLPWFLMLFQELDRPWTIKIPLKTVPGTIPETSTIKRSPRTDFRWKMTPPDLPNETLNSWKIELGPLRDHPWDPKATHKSPKCLQGVPRASKNIKNDVWELPKNPPWPQEAATRLSWRGRRQGALAL